MWVVLTASFRGLLIELPQPGTGVDVPDTATVLANCTVNLSRKGAKGDSDARNGVCICGFIFNNSWGCGYRC
jgi:hypothetical protein